MNYIERGRANVRSSIVFDTDNESCQGPCLIYWLVRNLFTYLFVIKIGRIVNLNSNI